MYEIMICWTVKKMEVSFLNQFKHMVLDFKFPCSNASGDGVVDGTTNHSSHNHIANGRSRCDNHLGNLWQTFQTQTKMF